MIAAILLSEPFIVPMFVQNASAEVYGYCSLFFAYTLPFYFLLGALAIYRTSVQSLGNSKAPFAACILELIARCSASIILGSFIGYPGIVLSSPLAWLGADLIVIPAYYSTVRRLENV